MNKNSASKPILLVLYPYAVSEFLYNLMELDYYSPYCDVIVWDVSRLTNPTFASALTYARDTRSNIVSAYTWTQFCRCVADLKQLSLTHAVTIRNHMLATNAAQFLITTHVYYSFRKSAIKLFDVINDGLPVLTATSANTSPHKVPSTGRARFRTFFRHISSVQALNTRIAHTIFRAFARTYSGALTHRLVAGQHYLLEGLRGKTKGTTLLFGHSDDYSNYLRNSVHYTAKTPDPPKIAVLLDAPGPAFPDDYIQMGRTLPSTAAVWYPALAKFFKRLEADAGVSICLQAVKETSPHQILWAT